jgi:hypothetical protein
MQNIDPDLEEIQRAWSFYNNDVYDDDYISNHKLFVDTKEIYNPVPKTAFIMNALTMKKNLDIEVQGEDEESNSSNNAENPSKKKIEDIWDQNNFQSMKYILVLWLILTQKSVIELNKKDDDIIFTLHDPSNTETKKQGNKTIYAKIEGKTEKFNLDTKDWETIPVVKEYYNVDGYRVRREYHDGELNQETSGPLAFDFIPVIEFETNYNLEPMFNKIDQYNQIEAYLNNIFWLHGEPAIWDNKDGKQFNKESKDKVDESRYQDQTFFHLGDEGQMQYLEMQGNVAQLMLEKQEDIKEILANDYPEYVLATLLSSGDPSGEALKVKAIEIEAKVESLRGDINNKVVEMDNMALKMLGQSELDHKLSFGGILPSNLKELVGMIESLRGIRMISRKTGMSKVPELISDPDEELDRLEEEDQQVRNDIASELSEHSTNNSNTNLDSGSDNNNTE